MAHKLLLDIEPSSKKEKRFKLPELNGKFGLALFLGDKEVFIGVAIANVEVEQITKRRLVKAPHATVKTFRFDPMA